VFGLNKIALAHRPPGCAQYAQCEGFPVFANLFASDLRASIVENAKEPLPSFSSRFALGRVLENSGSERKPLELAQLMA
jgi:hypothetical protein